MLWNKDLRRRHSESGWGNVDACCTLDYKVGMSMNESALSNPRVLELFNEKIDRSAGPDGCWPWLAFGAGFSMYHGGKQLSIVPQRAAWIVANGPIRGRLFVMRCKADRRCCNPAHLRLGTAWDVARNQG